MECCWIVSTIRILFVFGRMIKWIILIRPNSKIAIRYSPSCKLPVTWRIHKKRFRLLPNDFGLCKTIGLNQLSGYGQLLVLVVCCVDSMGHVVWRWLWTITWSLALTRARETSAVRCSRRRRLTPSTNNWYSVTDVCSVPSSSSSSTFNSST